MVGIVDVVAQCGRELLGVRCTGLAVGVPRYLDAAAILTPTHRPRYQPHLFYFMIEWFLM